MKRIITLLALIIYVTKVNAQCTINVTPTTATICAGTSVTLTASGNTSNYNWTPSTGLNTTISCCVIASPTASSVYSVIGQDAFGYYCAATATITVTNCTGIETFNTQTSTFQIYPNPNNGSFVIEPSNQIKQTMQVYDVNGKLVFSQTIEGKTAIDASTLNEGVYNISIVSANGILNKRLVIVR